MGVHRFRDRHVLIVLGHPTWLVSPLSSVSGSAYFRLWSSHRHFRFGSHSLRGPWRRHISMKGFDASRVASQSSDRSVMDVGRVALAPNLFAVANHLWMPVRALAGKFSRMVKTPSGSAEYGACGGLPRFDLPADCSSLGKVVCEPSKRLLELL